MKALLVVVLMSFVCASGIMAQTQAELNSHSLLFMEKSEAKLDSVITKIKHQYQGDTVLLNALMASQLAWQDFRLLQVKMKFPERVPGWYGSNHSMCLNMYMADLTSNRIRELLPWLQGSEGDACSGSIDQ